MQAAFLRIFLQQLDGWNAGRRAAAARYAELGLGELVEIPQDEPGHVYHLFVCRSPERDAHPRRAHRGGHRVGDVLHDAAPSPAVAALPRLRARLAAGDRAGGRPENFSLPLWPGIPAEAQERVVDDGARRPSAWLGRSAMRQLLSRHRLWQLAGRRGDRRGGVVARVPAPVRPRARTSSTTRRCSTGRSCSSSGSSSSSSSRFGFYNRWWRYVSISDMWAIVRGVVVACSRRRRDLYLVSAGAQRSPAARRSPRSTSSSRSRSSLGSRLLARTVMERPGPERRRARQGGDRRRRRRRGPR